MPDITNAQNIQAWIDAAGYVTKNFTADGDFYRKHVLNPALFSLLGDVNGKLILDAGCGEGYLCRMLAKKGAIVTGLEPAHGLVQHAIDREAKERCGITYIEADLSVWQERKNSFDIVVSNMVLMDIPDYISAMKHCVAALKPGGSFIFSISHPCFDEEDSSGNEKPYVEVKNYFTEYKLKNQIGYSFHRMLSAYVNVLIEDGCSIEKMLEPQLSPAIAKEHNKSEREMHVPNFLLIQAFKNLSSNSNPL